LGVIVQLKHIGPVSKTGKL